MAAGNLFKKAAAYRRKHKNLSMAEAVKAVSRQGKKKAAVGGHRRHKAKPKARKKAARPKPPKKVKTKIKIKKVKNGLSLGISGISLDKVHQELRHQQGLHTVLNRHRAMLKTKGLRPAEKQQIRRDIAAARKAIQTSKQHVTALKRSI